MEFHEGLGDPLIPFPGRLSRPSSPCRNTLYGSSTHIAHYAITALAKRDSNTINKGNTSRNMRSHSAIYRVCRDFFTGLQKHVSVTIGVLLCNTMSQLTACLEGTGRESLPTEGREAWPGAGHGFTTSLPSDSCLLIPTDSCLSIPVDSSSRLTR